MIKVNVLLNNIHWNYYIKNPNAYIDRKIGRINKKEKLFKKKVLICSLLLSGPSEIKKLNTKFRNKNKSTDVLSFPFYSKKKLAQLIKKEKDIYLGDIIINLKEIKNKNNKTQFKKNFDYLWIHGLLHLFGHKHKLNKDFRAMRRIEKKYFQYINE